MSRGYEWARNLTPAQLRTYPRQSLTHLEPPPDGPFVAILDDPTGVALGKLQRHGAEVHTKTLTVAEDRYKSKTERRFAQLLTVWQYEGKVKRWWYEPMKGLFLAPSTTYTPDFLVEPSSTNPPDELRPYLDHAFRLIVCETKGKQIWEKDAVKVKTAAALYPCFRFVRAQWKHEAWHWKVIPPVEGTSS